MYWANFLHIYQPPTQKPIWVKRIADESYRKILAELKKAPQVKTTLNINGILCELLDKNNCRDVISDIKFLAQRGQIELTGSAKYHAFLPKLPSSEIIRQIKLNEETLKKYFGSAWQRRGFFPPEMAYSKKVAEAAKKLGYRYILVDELAFPSVQVKKVYQENQIKADQIYEIKGLKDFFVFFRERNFSFRILSAQIGVVSVLLRELGERLSKNEYLFTAMDGETFGHHRPGLEKLLFEISTSPQLKTVTISELISSFPKREVVEPRDSTWALVPHDLARKLPYARWADPKNKIQVWQWQLTNLALKAVKKKKCQKARNLLDAALHSDQYWWASARPWWSLEMIERGAKELKDTVLIAPGSSVQDKKSAQDLYEKIIFTGFEWQRSGLVDEISRQEDEETRERLEEKEKLFITEEEYEKMIETLREQMYAAAKNEEYHRAGMIQDRIRELKEEMKKNP
ncbi:MAG: UvrB/UvrC motif-containing protein [bacterium]|nr:UvrB/UvrC motif-containing protein [bacterium]